MSESHASYDTIAVGDKFYMKEDVAVKVGDVLALTGTTSGRRAEVDKMSSNYSPNDVIGVSGTEMAADYVHRNDLTVKVKGGLMIKVAEDVVAGDKLMGASNVRTDLFSGDGTAQQELTIGNVPISSMVSVTELGGPTVLTLVSGTPTTGEYSIDLDLGVLIIGGTSVSGTDNYEVVYNLGDGRLEPLLDWVEEDLVVSTNVGTLTYPVEQIEYVEATTGTYTGPCGIITQGSVATTQVLVDRAARTLTFAAADAVTACTVRYRTTYKPCGQALEAKSQGEFCTVHFTGVDN